MNISSTTPGSPELSSAGNSALPVSAQPVGNAEDAYRAVFAKSQPSALDNKGNAPERGPIGMKVPSEPVPPSGSAPADQAAGEIAALPQVVPADGAVLPSADSIQPFVVTTELPVAPDQTISVRADIPSETGIAGPPAPVFQKVAAALNAPTVRVLAQRPVQPAGGVPSPRSFSELPAKLISAKDIPGQSKPDRIAPEDVSTSGDQRPSPPHGLTRALGTEADVSAVVPIEATAELNPPRPPEVNTPDSVATLDSSTPDAEPLQKETPLPPASFPRLFFPPVNSSNEVATAESMQFTTNPVRTAENGSVTADIDAIPIDPPTIDPAIPPSELIDAVSNTDHQPAPRPIEANAVSNDTDRVQLPTRSMTPRSSPSPLDRDLAANEPLQDVAHSIRNAFDNVDSGDSTTKGIVQETVDTIPVPLARPEEPTSQPVEQTTPRTGPTATPADSEARREPTVEIATPVSDPMKSSNGSTSTDTAAPSGSINEAQVAVSESTAASERPIHNDQTSDIPTTADAAVRHVETGPSTSLRITPDTAPRHRSFATENANDVPAQNAEYPSIDPASREPLQPPASAPNQDGASLNHRLDQPHRTKPSANEETEQDRASTDRPIAFNPNDAVVPPVKSTEEQQTQTSSPPPTASTTGNDDAPPAGASPLVPATKAPSATSTGTASSDRQVSLEDTRTASDDVPVSRKDDDKARSRADEPRMPAIDAKPTQADSGRAVKAPVQLNDQQIRQLINEVSEAVHRAGETHGKLRIRLTPPELGTMQIEVIARNGTISARLQVENHATQQLLMEHSAQLKQAVTHTGLSLDRIDIHLTDAKQQQNPSSWTGRHEQQSSNNDSSHSRREEQEQRRDDAGDEPEASEPPRQSPHFLDELDIQI